MVKDGNSGLPVVGWREWVRLPELGVKAIKAKVDTGARSCSLHVFDLREFQLGGTRCVRFKVYPLQRTSHEIIETEATIVEFRSVRSSSGKVSRRPLIVTPVTLLGVTVSVELTLANRDEMGFRMLLGREAIRGRFLVDAGKSFYAGRPERKRKKNDRKPPFEKTKGP